MASERGICLVGVGNIAATHAEAIQSISGLALAAAVDPNSDSLERFRHRWGTAVVCQSISEALNAGGFVAAHVLTPPDLHAETAAPFIEAGIDVLIEKPMAASAQECRALVEAAKRSSAFLGVNQNFVFDPAFARLRARVAAGEIGALRHVSCIFHAPLRQLEARQFGHWMFQGGANILLEQAVHPLSQIRALVGPLGDFVVHPDVIEKIGGGKSFLKSFSASIDAQNIQATLRFSVGESYPAWKITAYGADGVLVADVYQSRCYAMRRTQWLEAIDQPISALRTAGAIAAGSIGNSLNYGLAQVRLKRRSDPFFRSMRASISAFHSAAANRSSLETDGAFGRDLVDFCEKLAAAAFPSVNAAKRGRPIKLEPTACDVTVLGGTGFIGAHVVEALVKDDYSVCVMARSASNLDPVFDSDRVFLLQGDVRRREDVERAIRKSRLVINLAHGGGGVSYEEMRAAMVGSAAYVADSCLKFGVERLIHISSIAALYLGADVGVIRDNTPSDSRPETRSDYARAKAETDESLFAYAGRDRLPLVLLRPGLVVGKGASPFHSGLGFYNNDQHCIGWSGGRNPLPFVLVTDVAQAIVSSLTATGVVGKSFNLVGDVRPTAREYVAELARYTKRPLRFHAGSPTYLWFSEIMKWSVKKIGGRRVAFPSRRDFASRALAAEFDCSDGNSLLNWRPVSDERAFYESAFGARAAPLAQQSIDQ